MSFSKIKNLQRLRMSLNVHWAAVLLFLALYIWLHILNPHFSIRLVPFGISMIATLLVKEWLIRRDIGVIARFYWAFVTLDVTTTSIGYALGYPINYIIFPFYLMVLLKATMEMVPGELKIATNLSIVGILINLVFQWASLDWQTVLAAPTGVITVFAPIISIFILLGFSYIASRVSRINRDMTDRLNEALQQKEESLSQLVMAHVSLEEKYVESYTLNLVQESIFQQLDQVRILENAADILMGVMGSGSCFIYLKHPKETVLRRVVKTGSWDGGDFKDTYTLEEPSIICQAFENETFFDESALTSDVRELLQGHGIRSLLCVPLSGQAKLWGLIILAHGLADAFPQEKRNLLKLIARQLGLAVDNSQLHQEVKELATHDQLTGLYNRHFLNSYLDRFDEQIASGDLLHLAAIVLDIDNFKLVNDTYGHLAGDQILEQLSSIIKTVGKGNIAARYGGEEFIVLSEESPEKTIKLAEKLRKQVERTRFTVNDEQPIKVTISCGVSSIPEDVKNTRELLSKGDKALYHAKREGRNRTERLK